VRLKLAKLPDGTRMRHILGVSMLSGIGFTMSLFIGMLAFEDAPRDFAVPIRIGVLGGSLVAGLAGLVFLWATLPKLADGDGDGGQNSS
jgi:NhaA family Na+:H+ antiporter